MEFEEKLSDYQKFGNHSNLMLSDVNIELTKQKKKIDLWDKNMAYELKRLGLDQVTNLNIIGMDGRLTALEQELQYKVNKVKTHTKKIETDLSKINDYKKFINEIDKKSVDRDIQGKFVVWEYFYDKYQKEFVDKTEQHSINK